MSRKQNNKYRCRLFLKDKADKKLLTPCTRLYGQIIESVDLIFMTPYKRADNSLHWIGIVQGKPGPEHQIPLLINIIEENGNLIARGFIRKKYIEVVVEVVYMSDCYERTPFKQSEMDALWQKRVIIFGSGTGGSNIALELARAGVGSITLCDPQKLDFANVSRHEGDLLDVDKAKTQVVAERINRINPAITIKTYFEDIFESSLDRINRIISEHDLVVASTDITAIQLIINEITYKQGIACVFGGCYEEARGGEVFFTLPGEKMPCLACLRGGLKQPKRNRNIDYSTAVSSEDYHGQPGLHSAVDLVTSIEIQICLGILLRENKASRLAQMIDAKRNFILIGGMFAEGFYRFKKPFEIFYQPLKGPRKSCPVCGNCTSLIEEKNI